MVKADIEVDNLIGRGCAEAIRHGLLAVSDVNRVYTDFKKGVVKVEFLSTVNVAKIKRKLAQMGFPEKGKSCFFDYLRSRITNVLGFIIP